VEGAAPRITCGSARLLKEDRPIVLSELHSTQLERASGVTADQFLAEIHAIGYRAHRLESPAQAGHHIPVVGTPLDRAPAGALVSIVLLPS